MTEFAFEKQTLRRVMREKLRAQTAPQLAVASQQIAARLNALKIKSGGIVLFLAQPREPNVDEFARVLMRNGMRVFAPHARGREIFFDEIAPDWSNVSTNAHGWREPREYSRPEDDQASHKEKISTIFLPGLAFDLKGNRLGQGGGWYDRALKSLPPGVLRVGVCFDFQIIEHVPCEAHDQRVEVIVSERRTIGI
jgi:5-formyltetrahydrofolate cyclo-ligase